MDDTLNVLKEFPGLVRVTRGAHEDYALEIVHHDFDHALQVAAVASMVAEDLKIARLTVAAALCHNADRMLEKRRVAGKFVNPSSSEVEKLVRFWLAHASALTESEKSIIVDAVLEHSKPNDVLDSPVTTALKDADRIVCLGLDVIVRGAQDHSCPTVDPWRLRDDTRGRYGRRQSIVKVLQDCLEWASDDPRFGVRLPKSREMAGKRAQAIRWYIETVIAQREDLGLVPYPLPEPTRS